MPLQQQVPIAVVGMGAIMPGAADVASFWRCLIEGQDLITDIPEDRWLLADYYDADPFAPDRTYSSRGAFLPEVDFDPPTYGITPKAAFATDSTQMLALLVADATLADVGDLGGMDRERVSVILGGSQLPLAGHMAHRSEHPVWRSALRRLGWPESEVAAACEAILDYYQPWQESTFPGLLSNVVAGRIANRFDLHGTNCTVDAACASSLAALSMGIDELSLGRADLVLTGGVDAGNEPTIFMCFSKTPALSFTGDCRPFSDTADGTMLGEGLAMFALARLADAEAAGMRIHAVIRGLGSSSDGRGSSIYAPVAAGQVRALRRAYAAAGYGPDTVQLVEAHGTGTAAGDSAEFDALREVFDATGRPDRQWCALGSVKSQIGHTKCAAGAAGLLKAVLALTHRVLPPTIKVDRPDPRLDLASSPLYLNTTARPWIADPDGPRRAAVSSFGFGGTNFHVTLEEYVGEHAARRQRATPTELVLASGRSPEKLRASLTGDDLTELARRSQADFDPTAPARVALVATSIADLRAKLDRAIALGDRSVSTPDGTHLALGPATAGKVGFLFPGQGSQYVGMGTDVTLNLPAAQATWDSAAAAVPGLGAVVFPPPVFTDTERVDQERLLTRCEWAAPALAATSVALLTILRLLGVRPDAVAGHSLGELVALCAAGVFDEPTVLRLARRRGELVRDATGGVEGAMLVVLAASSKFDLGGIGDVCVANYNGPDEIVLSGTVEGISAAKASLTGRGIGVRHVNATTAFHSPIVAPAVAPLRHYLAGLALSSPRVEVFGNIDAAPYPSEPDAIRDRLAAQVASPVRFSETIEAMYATGVRTFVEVGAGAVLTGMVDRTLAGTEHRALALDRRGVNGLTRLQQALGQLAVLGVPLDLGPLWDEPEPVRTKPAPLKPIKLGSGVHGRAYPPRGGAAALPHTNPEPPSAAAIIPPRPPPIGEPRPELLTPAELPATDMQPPPTDMQPPPTDTQPPPTVMAPPPPLDFQSAPASATPQPHSLIDRSGPQAAMSTPEDDRLRTIELLHRQVTQAHETYQQTMAEGHVAFLKVAEASLAAMTGNHGPPPAWHPATSEGAGGSDTDAAERLTATPSLAGNGPAAPSHTVELPALPESSAAPAPNETVAQARAPAAAKPLTLALSLVMAVVADKTGYPVEVIGPEMDLETDLGIDSIKRVEILAALRDELPDLANMIDVGSEQATELVKLRTVGEISERLRAALTPETHPIAPLGPPTSSSADPEPVAGPPAPSSAPTVEARDITSVTSTRELLDNMGLATSAGVDPDATPGSVITRRVTRTVTAPAPGLATRGFGTSPIVVTNEGTGIAEALAEGLRVRGIAVTVIADGDEPPGDARHLILLDGLGHVGCPEDAKAVQRRAFRSARMVAAAMERDGGLFVTVQDTGGDFGLGGTEPDRAWLGGLAALARTAAREWPQSTVKAIDCERGGRRATEVAEAIITELETGGTDLDVGLSATNTRLTLKDVDSPAVAAGPTRLEGKVVVVTGGARGIAAAAMLALAERSRPRLVLLGRTRLIPPSDEEADEADEAALIRLFVRPGTAPAQARAQALAVLARREVRKTLAALADIDVDARYVNVDVTDKAALATAFADIRRDMGPITGIVHGAAVLADKRIADKTDCQFDAVFGTKVDGLQALLEETVTDPLRLVVAFGSVVGRFGNAGQCDYAMANATMTHVLVAEAIRRPDCIVRSLLWGPWAGGMVTQSLAGYLDKAGVPLIELAIGADAFCAELAVGPGPVPVLLARAGPRPTMVDVVHVSHRTHPELADHAPAGIPVLPMASVLDWFAGAAGRWCPVGARLVLRDVRVLRGVELTDFADGGHTFEVRGARPSPNTADLLTLELYGDGAVPYYRATATATAADAPAADDCRWSTPPDLAPLAVVYDGRVLFHGPRFRAIRAFDGVSVAGAAGTLVGADNLGWTGSRWHLDPAAIDGGLQMAVAWGQVVLGAASLPMSVTECRVHRDGFVAAPVRCVVRGGRVRPDAADCDIGLFEPDGTVIVELLGVTLVRRPR